MQIMNKQHFPYIIKMEAEKRNGNKIKDKK